MDGMDVEGGGEGRREEEEKGERRREGGGKELGDSRLSPSLSPGLFDPLVVSARVCALSEEKKSIIIIILVFEI